MHNRVRKLLGGLCADHFIIMSRYADARIAGMSTKPASRLYPSKDSDVLSDHQLLGSLERLLIFNLSAEKNASGESDVFTVERYMT